MLDGIRIGIAGDKLPPAVIGGLFVLPDDAIALAGDLGDGSHAYQASEGDALCPDSGLYEFLSKAHGLGVDVSKDADHARGPSGGYDGELVFLGPGERLVACGERVPFGLGA